MSARDSAGRVSTRFLLPGIQGYIQILDHGNRTQVVYIQLNTYIYNQLINLCTYMCTCKYLLNHAIAEYWKRFHKNRVDSISDLITENLFF